MDYLNCCNNFCRQPGLTSKPFIVVYRESTNFQLSFGDRGSAVTYGKLRSSLTTRSLDAFKNIFVVVCLTTPTGELTIDAQRD